MMPTTVNRMPAIETVSPTAGRPLKSLLAKLAAEEHDAAALDEILGVIQRPSRRHLVADLAVLRVDAADRRCWRGGRRRRSGSQRTVSRLHCFTSGGLGRIGLEVGLLELDGPCRRARRPPARSSGPASRRRRSCRKRRSRGTSTPRKPLPYAMSSVTATMPHTMPSMVRKLRVAVAPQRVPGLAERSRATWSSASRLVAQGLDRIDRRGAARRIERGEERDDAQQHEGQAARTARSAAGQRRTAASASRLTSGAQAVARRRPSPPLRKTTNRVSTKNWRRIERAGRADRLAHADLARALAHRDQHHVHHADAAEQERGDADGAQEVLHAVGHLRKACGLLDRVPDAAPPPCRADRSRGGGPGRARTCALAGLVLLETTWAATSSRSTERRAAPAACWGSRAGSALNGMKTFVDVRPS